MDLERVLPHLPVAVCELTVSIEGNSIRIEAINFLNDCIERISGFKLSIIQKSDHFLESLHSEDRAKFKELLRSFLLSGSPTNMVYRLKREDGSYAHILHVNIHSRKEDDAYHLLCVLEDISKQEELKEVFLALEEAPSVGIVIYQERIVYANKTAAQILGYSVEELKQYGVEHFVRDDYKEYILQTVKRRLRGEMFDKTYVELPVITKDGKERIIYTFTKTIFWNGKPAGLVIFVDITKRKRYERLYTALREINSLVIKDFDEEELLRDVCRLLHDRVGFRMVFAGTLRGKEIEPLEVCGHDGGFVEYLIDNLKHNREIMNKLLKGDIVLTPDVRSLSTPEAKEMLSRDYMSSCIIPLKKGKDTVALVGIYSFVPSMFTQEELELLKEVQKDISFALEYIERERYLKIISTAIEEGHEWVVITDEEGNILYANRNVSLISGYELKEIIGKNPRIFKSGYHSKEFYQNLWKTIKSGKVFSYVFVNRNRKGKLFYLDQSIVPVHAGGRLYFVGIGKDITLERYLEEELSRLKYVDPTTGLLNRKGFITSSEALIERDKDKHHAVFILDIMNFTAINQVYGTQFGDKVLKAVAQTLKGKLFKRDVVARLGSDEFAILTRDVGGKNIHSVINKLLEAFSEPLRIEDKDIKINITVGAALYPEDASNIVDLLQKASLALSFAREEQETNYSFYNEDINLSVVRFFHTKREIERAIQEDRFIIHFQPFYYTETKKIAGLETLLRMVDDEGNVLPPSKFISVLERTELMKEVEEIILGKIRAFLRDNGVKIPISFNVSPKSFKDSEFLNRIRGVSEELGECLILEITERLFIEDKAYTAEFLEEVKKFKVKVAIDDFGTGYSSLAYLESLPVDILKIDMQFIHRMLSNPRSLAIVQTIIDLGRRLNYDTIAEGIETEQQLKVLEHLNPTMIQGFFLARPMPPEEALRLLL
jgi:diguanylate cyclase (GGDEF)-like protein/PAS domain S-box-containing protein